jgi:hypothetical protein
VRRDGAREPAARQPLLLRGAAFGRAARGERRRLRLALPRRSARRVRSAHPLLFRRAAGGCPGAHDRHAQRDASAAEGAFQDAARRPLAARGRPHAAAHFDVGGAQARREPDVAGLARRAHAAAEPPRVRGGRGAPPRVGTPPRRAARGALRRPRPVQGGERHLRAPCGRRVAAQPRADAPRQDAALRYPRAPGRRRVRRAPRRLRPRACAAGREPDSRRDPRLPLRLGRARIRARREHRRRGDHGGKPRPRERALGGRHGVLSREGQGTQPGAGLPGRRRGSVVAASRRRRKRTASSCTASA